MSPFLLLLGEPPIMLLNMKYISHDSMHEKSLLPHNHQFQRKYMETNHFIKIFIDLACINYFFMSVLVANQPKTNFH